MIWIHKSASIFPWTKEVANCGYYQTPLLYSILFIDPQTLLTAQINLEENNFSLLIGINWKWKGSRWWNNKKLFIKVCHLHSLHLLHQLPQLQRTVRVCKRGAILINFQTEQIKPELSIQWSWRSIHSGREFEKELFARPRRRRLVSLLVLQLVGVASAVVVVVLI